MAITRRAISSNGIEDSSSLTVSKPSGVVDDDVMVMMVEAANYNDAMPTITASGWTEIATTTYTTDMDYRVSLYYKVASSEGTEYTITKDTIAADSDMSAAIAAYSDVDTLDVVNQYSNVQDSPGTSKATILATGFDTDEDGCMCIVFGQYMNPSVRTATITSFSEWLDTYYDADYGYYNHVYVADYTKATAGTVSNETITYTASSAERHAFMVALNLASGAVTHYGESGLDTSASIAAAASQQASGAAALNASASVALAASVLPPAPTLVATQVGSDIQVDWS